MLISWSYSLIDFQGQISKKEIDNVMCTLGSSGGFPKMGIAHVGLAIFANSALQACYFGKCLLTVGDNEHKEIAISPLILNNFVALFLEHIPYMYMHLSGVLEC